MACRTTEPVLGAARDHFWIGEALGPDRLRGHASQVACCGFASVAGEPISFPDMSGNQSQSRLAVMPLRFTTRSETTHPVTSAATA